MAENLRIFGTTYTGVTGFKVKNTDDKTLIYTKDFDITDYGDIQAIVRAGQAQEYFELGDQIVMKWSPDGVTEYDMPWDVVSFDAVTDDNDQSHANAMWLQSHYVLPGVQFGGNSAFYVPTAQMNAGTYRFSTGIQWGSNVSSGKTYYFTTTQAIPAGGQLVLGTASSNTSMLPDTAVSNWRVRTFSNGLQKVPTEILSVTEGSSGTNLGTLTNTTKYTTSGINNIQMAAYGYNRYAHSAIRQWLNSSAAADSWWTQQNPFDHRPDELESVRGFMAGLPNGFLSIVNPVKVTTALNTVSDSQIGTSESVYDKFFLASMEQEYVAPQLNDVEGSYWPYWKARLNLSSPQQTGTTYANSGHIRYSIANHSTACIARLRSANRTQSYGTWNSHTDGRIYNSAAVMPQYPSPACVIY